MNTDKMYRTSEYNTEQDLLEAQDEECGSSTRSRRLTEKGLAYQIELKLQNCKAVQKQIEKYMCKIDLLLSQYWNVYTMENNFQTVQQMSLVNLKILFNAWSNLLKSEEDKVSAYAWYSEIVTRNSAFEVKVRSWINQVKRSIEEQQDQRSNILLGSRKSSVVSKRSKLSNSSVRNCQIVLDRGICSCH